MPPAHPLDAVTHPDPYSYYATLARDQPLYRDATLGMWVAAHPETITAVMRHPAARVRPADEPVPRALCPGPAGELFGRFVRMNDGAAHARLKTLLVAFIQEQDREHRQEPARPLPPFPRDAAGIDRYLYAAPVYAQAAFLGLDHAQHEDCAADINSFLFALPANADSDRITAGHAAAARLMARLQAHLAGPCSTPALRRLNNDAAANGIAPDLVTANLAGLLFQSCEAGAGLLGNALIMAGRRGVSEPLTREAALALVDDVVRHDPPLHNTRRFMAEYAEIAGQRIAAGQTVLLVLAAAARIAPQADWTFGAQRHACPGAALARRHAADALLHMLRAGVDPAALAMRFRYRPLPNARVPQFDFQEDSNP